MTETNEPTTPATAPTKAQAAARKALASVADTGKVKLSDPFPASQVGILPKAGVKLQYVGHGAVTARLLDVDPKWTWEPLAKDANGLPVFDRDPQGRPIGLWIKLTVDGVTRLGYGDCAGNQPNAVKVLIGDALRNAAMRFGVALDLWVRGHSEDAEQFRNDNYREPQLQVPEPPSDEELERLLAEEKAIEERSNAYKALMARAKALKDQDEKYVEALRSIATEAGYATVNDWGKANLDAFAEEIRLLEVRAAQDKAEQGSE
jgi:hypothetical protein